MPDAAKCPECEEHPTLTEQSDEVGVWWVCPVCCRSFDAEDLESY